MLVCGTGSAVVQTTEQAKKETLHAQAGIIAKYGEVSSVTSAGEPWLYGVQQSIDSSSCRQVQPDLQHCSQTVGIGMAWPVAQWVTCHSIKSGCICSFQRSEIAELWHRDIPNTVDQDKCKLVRHCPG